MGKAIFRNVAGAVAAVAVVLGVIACGGGGAAAGDGKPGVLCSIFSYFDAARAIGGDKVDAKILLPPATSPHDYEASTSDRVLVSQAALFIKNGMGLDDRFDKMVAASKARVLTISDWVPKR